MTRSRRAFWTLFLVTGALYAVIVAWSLPIVTQAAGGLAPFDLRPTGYSLDEAKAFLTALTTAGYVWYLDVQHSLDTIYPALYGATLFFAIALLTPASWGPWRWLLAVAGLPASVFDYLENAAVGRLLRSGPADITVGMVETASRWTVLKSAATTVAMVLVLLLLGLKIILARSARTRRAAAAPEPDNTRYGDRLRKWTAS